MENCQYFIAEVEGKKHGEKGDVNNVYKKQTR